MALRFGGLGETTVHICVDMQRLFAEGTDWHTPWMHRVVPQAVALTERRPAHTVFTRFVPLRNAEAAPGTWRRYYERWPNMTLDALAPEMIDLLAPLQVFVPPARVLDKHIYSPWPNGALHTQLRQGGIDTLVISGGETEICVLATMLGAIELGYRVILATDALCSSADETHDAMMRIYESRFGMQMETAETDEILDAWR